MASPLISVPAAEILKKAFDSNLKADMTDRVAKSDVARALAEASTRLSETARASDYR